MKRFFQPEEDLERKWKRRLQEQRDRMEETKLKRRREYADKIALELQSQNKPQIGDTIHLNEEGYCSVASTGSNFEMELFVRRVVTHVGMRVQDWH